MIDFHSHILPGVDDGSKYLEESLQLLQIEQQQGIDIVVLTPHYYSSQNSPEAFFHRRQEAWSFLRGAWQQGMPRLLLGAEVEFFDGIATLTNLQDFCIQRTSLLLLEMPFCRWEPEIIDTVERLAETGKFSLVLAHADRYHPQDVEELLGMGVILQLNVDNLSNRWKNRQLLKWLDCGCVAAIGSDIHGTKTGYRYWNKCKKLLGGQWSEIMDRSASLTG